MDLVDFGNSLILKDIKRLKQIRSVEEDLETFFIKHKNTLTSFGKLSCEIASTDQYIICKERVGFSNPQTPPSKGGRLWFAITKNGHYIRCLLYIAKEEDKYPKSICFKIIKENLNVILNS